MSNATNSIKGVVDSVFTKDKKTKFGDKVINHVIVDGVEFQTGFKAVFVEGQMINAAVEFNYGAWQYVEGVNADALPPAVAQAAAAPAAVSGDVVRTAVRGAGAFPVDPKSGQISIIRQNSMNRAVEILENWMTMVSGTTPIFAPKDQEEYFKKLFEVALLITDFNSGQDIMQLQVAQVANLQVAAVA